MKEKIPVPVFIVTALLVVYTIMRSLDVSARITGFIFILSPFLLAWMVVSVLKLKTSQVEELAEEEEWGYADRKKEELGIF